MLWVDEPLLAALADRSSIRIWRVGTHGSPVLAGHTDVVSIEADGGRFLVRHDGAEVGTFTATSVHPGNVACAVAAVLAAGVPADALADRLARLEPPAAPGDGGHDRHRPVRHRRHLQRQPRGRGGGDRPSRRRR